MNIKDNGQNIFMRSLFYTCKTDNTIFMMKVIIKIKLIQIVFLFNISFENSPTLKTPSMELLKLSKEHILFMSWQIVEGQEPSDSWIS